ncbi:MAG TPA: plastocyanin/azurin family copper-binding protein [Tepidisphaeraceae bacterium]|jgi:plastocyanin|nr:plastocyanin/azurin family copper-binding protein [Tepidisphaeraceae bacterium]
MRRCKRMIGVSTFVGAMVVLSAIRGIASSATQAKAPATEPATQPASTIKGTVTAEGDVPLAEMVVYLESPEASRKAPDVPPTVKVSQKGAQFDPKVIVISIGQTIEFLNDEDRLIEHNVFSNSPTKRFDLGLYGPGQSKKLQFDKPGPVFLYCSIHRYMDGVVFVSPTPYFSRVEKNGAYKIENVPPGQWIVKTWQRRRRFAEKSVPVTAKIDRPSVVDLELKKK